MALPRPGSMEVEVHQSVEVDLRQLAPPGAQQKLMGRLVPSNPGRHYLKYRILSSLDNGDLLKLMNPPPSYCVLNPSTAYPSPSPCWVYSISLTSPPLSSRNRHTGRQCPCLCLSPIHRTSIGQVHTPVGGNKVPLVPIAPVGETGAVKVPLVHMEEL